MEKEIQKFATLGKEIIDFYHKNYGWDCYHIQSDGTQEYSNHVMRIYMADEGNHKAFGYKGIEVGYFSPPKIEFLINVSKKDFAKYIKELEELFNVIKLQFEEVDKQNIEYEKKKRIEALKFQLSELEK